MSRHAKAEPGTKVGALWFKVGETKPETLEAFSDLLEPEPFMGMHGALVTGDDARFYWLTYLPAPDMDELGRDPFGVTLTLREVHEDGDSVVRGPVVSRRIVTSADLAEQFVNDRENELSDEDLDAFFRTPEAYVPVIEAVAKVLRVVGVEWEDDGTTTIIGPGGGRKSRDVPSVGDALAEAWPHDDWSGTIAEVHELVGGTSGPYKLDALRKALDRGDYESTGEPGKPSVWRRVPRRR